MQEKKKSRSLPVPDRAADRRPPPERRSDRLLSAGEGVGGGGGGSEVNRVQAYSWQRRREVLGGRDGKPTRPTKRLLGPPGFGNSQPSLAPLDIDERSLSARRLPSELTVFANLLSSTPALPCSHCKRKKKRKRKNKRGRKTLKAH